MCLGVMLAFGQTVYAAPEAGTAQTTAVSDIKEPEIEAQGACLMDAATGQVLFGKNQDKQFFPASITKVMTSLLVLENCSLTDVVTFSKTATTNLEAGASGLDVSEGDQLTVEQALYGFLLKSANEIGNGFAEHIAGSNSAFAEKMNAKAAALGCKNTHFANPHGLNNTEHLTTAYDMCLIMSEALKNPVFRRIDSTTSYEFPAIKNAAAHTINMGHKMLYKTDSRYYEGIIGGKTGYTSKAGNTLVTGAERNGVRLVAVVLKSQGTHYKDTKALLDYGFQNYEALTGRKAGSAALPADTGAVQNVIAAMDQTSHVIQPVDGGAVGAGQTEGPDAAAAGSVGGPGMQTANQNETALETGVTAETSAASETSASADAAIEDKSVVIVESNTAKDNSAGQQMETAAAESSDTAGWIDQFTGAKAERKAPGM